MKAKITFKKSNADELISKYEFYRSATKDGLYAAENKIGEVTAFSGSDTVSFTDSGAVYGTEYYYGLLSVAKAGYSIPSAPLYYCRYKNNGGIKPEFLVGDIQNGIVGYNKVDTYDIHQQVRAIFDKAMTEVNLPSSVIKNTYGNPPADQVITGYWRGMPVHWLPVGISPIYTITSTVTFAQLLQGIKDIFAKVKEKYPVIKVDGYDFYIDIPKKAEFDKMLLSTEIAFNNHAAITAPQPMAMTCINYYTNLRAVVVASDTTADTYAVYYTSTPSATALTQINPNTNSSSFTYPQVAAPIALRPVQY